MTHEMFCILKVENVIKLESEGEVMWDDLANHITAYTHITAARTYRRRTEEVGVGGWSIWDAATEKEVLVLVSLLICTADNDRRFELLNHLGCSANHFCSQLKNLESEGEVMWDDLAHHITAYTHTTAARTYCRRTEEVGVGG